MLSESPAKKNSMKSNRKKLAPLEEAPNATPKGVSSSTYSITHKKDLTREVRRLNPAGVNTAPNIFWDVEGALKSTNIDDSDVQQQMIIVENGVNYNIKRYNDLKVMNERLTMDLKKKLDELQNEKKSFEALDSMKKAETGESKRIASLHKEVAQVEERIMNQTHYSRKLEHMLNRLKSNQLKFDSHMTGMEDTMRNIQKDGADVVLMRRGLDAGLAKAVIVLEETKEKLAYSRKDREVLILQRKAEYKQAKVLNEWLKAREQMKKEMGIELRGDITMEEELFLKSQIEEKLKSTRILQKASENSLKELQTMEEAFTKLKQVTGVRVVDEMHEKFFNQKTNKSQLESEVKDAESRLTAAKKANLRQEAFFQELKSSGGGLAELNRESIIKLEDAFNDAKNDQKFIKADLDRLGAILLALHQGATGLVQRVSPYLQLAETGMLFELTQLGEEPTPWTETVDALTQTEHVLTKMMEAVSGEGPTVANQNLDDDDLESLGTKGSLGTQSSTKDDEAPLEQNNVRIKSKKFFRDLDDSKIDETNLGQPLDKNVEEGMKENNNNSSVVDGAALPPAVGATSSDALPALSSNPNLPEDPTVPSRLTMKKFAARRSNEALRKEEMELRRKRILDRMENKGAASGAAADDALMRTAQLKAQKESADRLCVDKKPPTLPDGVTLRDDPMTKTIAFLNSMPKLT